MPGGFICRPLAVCPASRLLVYLLEQGSIDPSGWTTVGRLVLLVGEVEGVEVVLGG